MLDPAVQSVLQACRDAQEGGGSSSSDGDWGPREREMLARRMREPEMAAKLLRLAAAGVLRLE